MGLYTDCSSCSKEVKLKESAGTRPELQEKIGSSYAFVCPKCSKSNTKTINQIYAKPNKIISLIGLLLGIVVTVLLWDILGAVGTISGAIPIGIWKYQENLCRDFNRYRIK